MRCSAATAPPPSPASPSPAPLRPRSSPSPSRWAISSPCWRCFCGRWRRSVSGEW
jgi:hypothetical protein